MHLVSLSHRQMQQVCLKMSNNNHNKILKEFVIIVAGCEFV